MEDASTTNSADEIESPKNHIDPDHMIDAIVNQDDEALMSVFSSKEGYLIFASELKTWLEIQAWVPEFVAAPGSDAAEVAKVNPILACVMRKGVNIPRDWIDDMYAKESNFYDEDTMVSALRYLKYWRNKIEPRDESEAYQIFLDEEEDEMDDDEEEEEDSEEEEEEDDDDDEEDEEEEEEEMQD
jgi:hypothetical protein